MPNDKLDIEPEDMDRARLYDFLGALLSEPPDQLFLDKVADLRGDDTEIGRTIETLRKLATVTTAEAVRSEFTALFIGVGRGELLPYCSYYRTGFLNEKPLAELRKDLARLRIKKAENVFEPEDGIASLMETMAALITGRLGVQATLAAQREFFDRHIKPWASHFYSDLEKATNAVFYVPVGTLGRTFMEIEAEAYVLAGSQARPYH